jgi:hypothetical protein
VSKFLQKTSSTSTPAILATRADDARALRVAQRVIEHLVIKFGAVQMAGVTGAADPELVLGVWAEGVRGFSKTELLRGLSASTTRFAPSLVEFQIRCRPGLDPQAAWAEGQAGAEGQPFEWSHEAVHEAARKFNFELRTSTYEKCRPAWTAELARQWVLHAPAQPNPLHLRLDDE